MELLYFVLCLFLFYSDDATEDPVQDSSVNTMKDSEGKISCVIPNLY